MARLLGRGDRPGLLVRSQRRASGVSGRPTEHRAALWGSPSRARGGGQRASRSLRAAGARSRVPAELRQGRRWGELIRSFEPGTLAASRSSCSGGCGEVRVMADSRCGQGRDAASNHFCNAPRQRFGCFGRGSAMSRYWANLTVRCTCRLSSGQPRRGRVWPCGARR